MKELINLFVNDLKAEQFTVENVWCGAAASAILVILMLVENLIMSL